VPVVSTAKMTSKQFLQLGEDPVGLRLELVSGEVAVSPSPNPEHSHIDRQLTSLLVEHVRKRKLGSIFGDVDTIFGDCDVRRPDLIYFSTKRMHLVGDQAMEGPPDLCVEIISPSTSTIDRVDKFEQYQAGGVLHYWVIDTHDRSIEGYQLRRGKYVLTGRCNGNDIVRLPPFPALEIPLERLWLAKVRKGRRQQK